MPQSRRETPSASAEKLVCRRCGYVFPPPPPKRCPNCERHSWAKPAHLLSTREMAGLDAQGFDREGRYRQLAIGSAEAEHKARRLKKVTERLNELLGESGD